MSSVSGVEVITEHPIPTDVAGAEDLQHSNPMFRDRDELLHPDELHELYKDVLAENGEWRVFRSQLHGQGAYVYLWNHQLGYGVRFYDVDSTFLNFAEVMKEATEALE